MPGLILSCDMRKIPTSWVLQITCLQLRDELELSMTRWLSFEPMGCWCVLNSMSSSGQGDGDQ